MYDNISYFGAQLKNSSQVSGAHVWEKLSEDQQDLDGPKCPIN